jgi:hypothetical protein
MDDEARTFHMECITSRTRSPGGKKDEQIDDGGVAVAVAVDVTAGRAPVGEEGEQVYDIDCVVAARIGLTYDRSGPKAPRHPMNRLSWECGRRCRN